MRSIRVYYTAVRRFDRHSNSRKPGARTTDFIINSDRELMHYILPIPRFVYCFGDRDGGGGWLWRSWK